MNQTNKVCTQCEHNGKCSSACLNCQQSEQYSYKYQQYLIDGYDPEQPNTDCSEQVTDLNEDAEDRFRKALYELFDLNPLELLLLQSIMHGKSLTEYANDMNNMT